jgi:hypothetical protein
MVVSDASSLAQSLSRWELAEYISCAFVALACAGEGVAEFTNWLTNGIEDRKKKLAKLSTLVLIASLAAELVCLVRTNTLSGQLIGSISEKAVIADTKAQSAQIAADQATKKVDEVGKEADIIADRLSKASKQLSVIEDEVAVQGPRWRILEGKRIAFIEALKPFAGRKVTVVRCEQISPGEQVRLEGSLIIYLGKEGAGWEVGYTVWANCHNWGASIGGNVVFYNSTASEAVKSSAKALAGILNKLKISTLVIPEVPEGWQSSVHFMGADSPMALAANDPTAVFLLVGPNPMHDLAGWSRPDLPGMSSPHK